MEKVVMRYNKLSPAALFNKIGVSIFENLGK